MNVDLSPSGDTSNDVLSRLQKSSKDKSGDWSLSPQLRQHLSAA